jgi:hypothetical protein
MIGGKKGEGEKEEGREGEGEKEEGRGGEGGRGGEREGLAKCLHVLFLPVQLEVIPTLRSHLVSAQTLYEKEDYGSAVGFLSEAVEVLYLPHT